MTDEQLTAALLEAALDDRTKLRTALVEVAAALAWHCFGECRSYRVFGKKSPPLMPMEADALARATLSGDTE